MDSRYEVLALLGTSQLPAIQRCAVEALGEEKCNSLWAWQAEKVEVALLCSFAWPVILGVSLHLEGKALAFNSGGAPGAVESSQMQAPCCAGSCQRRWTSTEKPPP